MHIANPLPTYGRETVEEYHRRKRREILEERARQDAIKAEAAKQASIERARRKTIEDAQRAEKERLRAERARLARRRYAVRMADGSVMTSRRPITIEEGWQDLGRVDQDV